LERLQKFLARAGIGSRRYCEQIILSGAVKVNGKRVDTLGTKVSDSDRVEVNGKLVKPVSEKLYFILNKPRGYVTTVKDDRGRKTVLDLLPEVSTRIYPVGRLDYDTEGLLLLTNDGNFAYALTHPKYKVPKTYLVKIKGIITAKEIDRLEAGILLEDGKTAPAKAQIIKIDQSSQTSTIKLTIREGKNRQVRRMCSTLGFPVLSLKRIQFGCLRLENLPLGRFRKLSKQEVNKLYLEAGFKPPSN